ncbi:hypothetical protein JANAI62_12200 [Jannaschia pagri]|uniref:DUF2726 domain-containing protein n=1 Tax=Jannaschia pagri TaxID=2829797 RepID=A0ABQ4NJJ8_9RHOB|nr:MULTISPECIES: DUF2726 domain-containing protein [unclassified Jannaschia]GIT90765.1 hypothetical protein JANAI61_12230 [Jannaschia sp. AI_61]GIT94597.1 hypothetical protein JANAI62_12200 [Jannaschia sp. AI_62]
MTDGFPAKTPLSSLLSFLPLRRSAPDQDAAFSHMKGAEIRERVFTHVSDLAHRHGLHVAPSVAMGAVFSVLDGRLAGRATGARSALAHARVDVLLLDRAARPVLALDHAPQAAMSRAERGQLRLKAQMFERAGLPLLILHGLAQWDDDKITIEAKLALLQGTSGPAETRTWRQGRRSGG